MMELVQFLCRVELLLRIDDQSRRRGIRRRHVCSQMLFQFHFRMLIRRKNMGVVWDLFVSWVQIQKDHY